MNEHHNPRTSRAAANFDSRVCEVCQFFDEVDNSLDEMKARGCLVITTPEWDAAVQKVLWNVPKHVCRCKTDK